MKNTLIAGIIALLALASCEKYDRDVIFAINDEMEFKADDISMYDTSSHILYLKRSYSNLEDIESGSFGFYDKGDPVLSGIIWPAYLSSIPSSPVIISFPYYLQSFALKIQTWQYDDLNLLNNARLSNLLNRHGLLHSGLSISDATVDLTGSELTFSFTITNMDQESLLVLDPEKTGSGLFRFFTNGLHIYDPVTNGEVFADNIPYAAPDPWDSWSMDWLTELDPGASKSFSFTYVLSTIPDPGQYKFVFEYPGLTYQVSRDDLYQGESRIWLGEIYLNRLMTIE